MKSVLCAGARLGKWFLVLFAVCVVLYPVRIFFEATKGVQSIPASSSVPQSMLGGVVLPTSPLAPGPPVVPTSSPTPAPSPAPGQPQGQGSSPPGCQMSVGFISLDLCTGIGAVIRAGILDPVIQFVLAVRDGLRAIMATDLQATSGNQDIIFLHGEVLLTVDAFLILIILITGIRMVWQQSMVSWADFRETIPQVLIAFLLAQLSLALCTEVITLNNALSGLFAPSGVAALAGILPANSSPLDLFSDFLTFVLGICVILLILEASVRIPVLNLCIVLSSAGCFALAWKPTQHYGWLWLNTFLATVFIQVLQVLCLVIGLVLFRSLQGQGHTYVTELGGIAILFAALALPFYVYRWAIQPVVTAGRATVRVAEQAGEAVIDTARAAAALAA